MQAMNGGNSNGYLMHNQSSSNQLSHQRIGQRKMKGHKVKKGQQPQYQHGVDEEYDEEYDEEDDDNHTHTRTGSNS